MDHDVILRPLAMSVRVQQSVDIRSSSKIETFEFP